MAEYKGLKYKTKENMIPQGMPRVYFCCHYDDFSFWFESLSRELLDIESNMALWYYDPREGIPDREDLFTDLSQMQLFVIPVTYAFLHEKNPARETEFRFAAENKIPVLPLAMEEGLAEDFNRICGNLQMLNMVPGANDETEIPCRDKIKTYLDSVLVGNELAEKVRAAFDAYIFLSYRKKDRRQAQQLMRLIHEIDFCRDIAIWYDEYLTPGEDFNDAIADAMKKCDVFAVNVTPNLLEKPNYVMDIEYPEAMQTGKPLIAIETVRTDIDEVKKEYEGLTTVVSSNDCGTISSRLAESLKNIALLENDTNPGHMFLIGLAYLNGIDVEVNSKMALKLIKEAADLGLPEACSMLVDMYRYGKSVIQNTWISVKWQKEYIRIISGEEKSYDIIDGAKELLGILTREAIQESEYADENSLYSDDGSLGEWVWFGRYYIPEKYLYDKDVLLEFVRYDRDVFHEIPEMLFEDKSFVNNILEYNGEALKYASEETRQNPEKVLRAVENNGTSLQYASEELKDNPQIVQSALRTGCFKPLKYASERLRSNREFIFSILYDMRYIWSQGFYDSDFTWDLICKKLAEHGRILEYLQPALQNDRELVLETVKYNGLELEFASAELRDDKNIVLNAVNQNGWALRYASERLRANKKIVYSAVKKTGSALEFAGDRLKRKKRIILMAVKHDENVIKYVPEKYRSDKLFMYFAVKYNGYALEYASEELRADRKIVLASLKSTGCALQYASDELRSDKKLVIAATENTLCADQVLKCASDELRADKETVLAAVKKDWRALRYASDELRADKEFVLTAVKNDGYSLQDASEELRSDKDTVLEAVKNNGCTLQYASEKLRGDKEIVLVAVKNDGCALEYASEELRADKDVVFAAVNNNIDSLRYATKTFRSDKVSMLAIVKTYGHAIKYASEELRTNKELLLIAESVIKNDNRRPEDSN